MNVTCIIVILSTLQMLSFFRYSMKLIFQKVGHLQNKLFSAQTARELWYRGGLANYVDHNDRKLNETTQCVIAQLCAAAEAS
jgi:hypothetical protein